MGHIIGQRRYARETYPDPRLSAAARTCDSLVAVRSLDDLPSPVDGVITLEPSTNYQVCGTVNISPNSLVAQDRTTISGQSAASDALVSAGFAASAMVAIGPGSNVLILEVSLSAPGAALFDADLGGTASFVILAALLVGSGSLGTVKNFDRFVGIGVGIGFNDDGWTVLGTNGDILWPASRVSDNLGTFTAWYVPPSSGVVCKSMLFATSVMDLDAGQTGFDFPDPASGLTVDRGAISSVFFDGAGTPLALGVGKITKATPQWTIELSPPLLNSVAIGGASYALTGGGGNSTGALTAGVFAPIPSAPSPFVASGSNERFTASAAGVLTYTGLDPIQVRVTVSVSVDMTGPGTNNYGCAIFMGGILVPNSEQTNQMVSAGSATSALTTSAVVTLNPGETVDGRIRNNSSGNPMNVYAAQISATSAA